MSAGFFSRIGIVITVDPNGMKVPGPKQSAC